MQEHYGKNDSFQYIFGDFILKNNGVLLFKNKEHHIPPKELGVIILLLNADGEIVSKEEIIDKVWSSSVASDESLTRCIYALRKLLHENKQCKYIETVYGRGYRFTVPIVVVTDNEPVKSSTTLAVFPFRTEGSINIVKLHYELVQGLSKYAFCGLDILPASVTNEVIDFSSIHQFINQTSPEYYIMGQVIHYGQNWRLFVELVHAKTHKLIEHQSIDFNPENPLSILLSQLINILIEKIPNINLQSINMQQMPSLDSAVMYMNGRMEMYCYTPDSLRRAMAIFMDCVSIQPQNTMPYCCLAECYISLALLGLYNQKQAITAAMTAVETALDINPSNSQALGLLGLISGLKNKHSIAVVLFKQAHLLKPNSPDIYYYNALFYFLKGDIGKALTLIDKSLNLAPNKMGISVLKLFILYYKATLDETISFALTLINQNNGSNPIVSAMIALLMALKGHKDKAKSLLVKFDTNSNSDYISANTLYTKYLLYGDSIKADIMKFLTNVNVSSVNGIILPLILTAYGKKEFDKRWQQLIKDNDIWSHVLINDPRFASMKHQLKQIEVAHSVD
ncbi:HilA/EilA family virulence transcriptional regulator [Escherichia albertii]|uniref:HilA/EilA family virulence transcriptional regulator n=1 Tax=Escherichia albertii TaxID=208962 RepID=UPI0025B2B1F4|nr:HilA/EilA family virulence transcriptional regulator [Escherichia albertii]MDN4001796.1 HilA/EilA family virulence transcriptional regulator [Escherichia albertii]